MKKTISTLLALLFCLSLAIPVSAETLGQLEVVPMASTIMIGTTYHSFDISGSGVADIYADMSAGSTSHPVKSTKIVAYLMQDGTTIKTFTATANDGFAILAKTYAVAKDHEYRVKYVFYAYSTDGLSENVTSYSQYVYYD